MKTWIDSMYDAPDGAKKMAAAGLRNSARRAIYQALKESGRSPRQITSDLGWSCYKSERVFGSPGGKITLNELADALSACGLEARISIAPLGTEHRQRNDLRQEK